jgi:hypothetical protein
MPQSVEISVKTQLDRITKQLEEIQRASASAERGIKTTAAQVDTAVATSMQKTQYGLGQSASLMRRTLQVMKTDLAALGTLGLIAGGFKLAGQFKESISGILSLTDAIRKYASVLKIADQPKFIGQLSRSLDEVGMGADVAAQGIEGLSHTQVRGEKAMIEYVKSAGMLASVGNQKEQTGNILGLLAGIQQARGARPEDTGAMNQLATQVLHAYKAGGGKGNVTDILTSIKDTFNGMATDFRKSLTPKAVSQIEAISAAGGEASASFIKDYLSATSISRAPLNAMGMGNLFTNQGVNEKVLSNIINKGKQSAVTKGDVAGGIYIASGGAITEDQAKGLVRLYENMNQVNRAVEEMNADTQTLPQAFDSAKTSGEAFISVLDRVRNAFSESISSFDQDVTGLFKSIQKSKTGSALTVGALGLGLAVGAGKLFSGLKSLFPRWLVGEAAAGAAGGAEGLGAASTGGLIGGAETAAAGVGIGAVGAGAAALGGGAVIGYEVAKAIDGSAFSKKLDDLILIMLKKSGATPEVVPPRSPLPHPLHVEVKLHGRDMVLKEVKRVSTGPSHGPHR